MSTQQTQPVTISPVQTQDSRPVPDPTEKTIELVLRKDIELKDSMHREDEHLRTLIKNLSRRFTEILREKDKAIKLLQDFANSSPKTAEVDLRVDGLLALVEEKFNGVQTQFLERDDRSAQTGRDKQIAIDAALQSQKDAVSKQNESNAQAIAKSEAAFTKQIDQQQQLITANNKATDERFTAIKTTTDERTNDLKSRLDRLEGKTKGMSEFAGWIVAGVTLLLLVATFIFIVLRFAGQGAG